jgi:phage baseplate assembly protein W
MSEPRAQVRNAADPQQVKRAERRDRDAAAQVQASLKAVLSTTDGRAVMWELLERAGVFRSIWHPSAEIHYRAGRQDYGHELQALILACDEELYDAMTREARARAKRAANETDAAHTARADQGVK